MNEGTHNVAIVNVRQKRPVICWKKAASGCKNGTMCGLVLSDTKMLNKYLDFYSSLQTHLSKNGLYEALHIFHKLF